VQRRPRSGRKHLTNITRIIRAEWIDWLSKGRRKAYAIKACNRAKPDFRLARGAQKNPPRSQLLGNSGSDRVDNLVKRLQDRVQPVTGEGCCMWDHDRDAALVELHSQGHSFAEIGQRVGVTRNAAISHFHWIRGTRFPSEHERKARAAAERESRRKLLKGKREQAIREFRRNLATDMLRRDAILKAMEAGATCKLIGLELNVSAARVHQLAAKARAMSARACCDALAEKSFPII
jgi:hypothetical protein